MDRTADHTTSQTAAHDDRAAQPGPCHDAPVDRIPGRGEYTEAARRERVAFLRRHSGHPLPGLSDCALEAASLRHNVENLVGAVALPLGLAGPLQLRGEHARDVVYLQDPVTLLSTPDRTALCVLSSAIDRAPCVDLDTWDTDSLAPLPALPALPAGGRWLERPQGSTAPPLAVVSGAGRPVVSGGPDAPVVTFLDSDGPSRTLLLSLGAQGQVGGFAEVGGELLAATVGDGGHITVLKTASCVSDADGGPCHGVWIDGYVLDAEGHLPSQASGSVALSEDAVLVPEQSQVTLMAGPSAGSWVLHGRAVQPFQAGGTFVDPESGQPWFVAAGDGGSLDDVQISGPGIAESTPSGLMITDQGQGDDGPTWSSTGVALTDGGDPSAGGLGWQLGEPDTVQGEGEVLCTMPHTPSGGHGVYIRTGSSLGTTVEARFLDAETGTWQTDARTEIEGEGVVVDDDGVVCGETDHLMPVVIPAGGQATIDGEVFEAGADGMVVMRRTRGRVRYNAR